MTKALLAGLIAILPIAAADGGAMSASERTYLLEQLEQSKKAMLSTIGGVSQAQWTYKPAPNVWSVKECAEHLILAEEFLMSTAQKILQTPAVERPASSNAQADHKLVEGIQDRSRKATAPEPIVPSGKFATSADAVKEFTARRDKSIAYVKSTNDDLRIHVAPGPMGPMDAYQFLLLMASHTVRHTAQMREVQSHADYPKTAE